MAVNDVVRLDIIASTFSQQIINSFHFQYQTGVASETDLLADWQTSCETEWRAIFENSYALLGYEARQVWPGPLDDQRGPVAVTRNLQGSRATGAGDYLPPWMATDVRIFTAGRGRSRHGRFFPCVQKEADIVRDDLQTVILTPLNAFVAKIMAVFGTGGTNGDYRVGVYSKKFAYLPDSHPPAFNPAATPLQVFREAVNMSPTGVLTTQRSRRG